MSEASVTPIKRETLGDQVAHRLRVLIATKELRPGTPVVEEALAARFAVSRGPVRDALRTLTLEGLVSVNGRRAEFVGLTATAIEELYTLREVLETAAVKRAMTRGRATLVRALETSLATMEKTLETGDVEAFAHADLCFHSSFYDAAEHHRLASVWSQYRPSVEMVMVASQEAYRDLAPAVDNHRRLVELIRRNDAQAVDEELRRHITDAHERVAEHWKNNFLGGATS